MNALWRPGIPTFNRREVLKLSGGAAAVGLTGGCVTVGGDGVRKRNFVHIVTDGHTAAAIGAYSGRLSALDPTPALDMLAAQGTVFGNALAQNPCDGSAEASGIAMRAAGYQTAMIGAWHLLEKRGAFDYTSVLCNHGDSFNPVFRVHDDNLSRHTIVQMDGHASDCITDSALDWLRSREGERPFSLMCHFNAPRDMFAYAPRYERYLADALIPEPDDLYAWSGTWGSTGTRDEEVLGEAEIGASNSGRHRLRNLRHYFYDDRLPPDSEYIRASYQACLKAYLRCVKGVDDNIARLSAYLERAGLWDDTIIIYSSTQTPAPSTHNAIYKRWIDGEGGRAPLIMRDPGIGPL